MRWQPCVCQNDERRAEGVADIHWLKQFPENPGISCEAELGDSLQIHLLLHFHTSSNISLQLMTCTEEKRWRQQGTKRFPGWRPRLTAGVYLTGVLFQITTIKSTDWRQKPLNRTLLRFYLFKNTIKLARLWRSAHLKRRSQPPGPRTGTGLWVVWYRVA